VTGELFIRSEEKKKITLQPGMNHVIFDIFFGSGLSGPG